MVKCGYKCKLCKHNHLFSEKLMKTVCSANPSGLHELAKKSYMCQHCDCVSDCAASFQKEICHGRRVIAEPPTSFLGPYRSPAPENPSPQQASAFMDLRVAELELNRLIQLKELEIQKAQLQALIDAKHRLSSNVAPGV